MTGQGEGGGAAHTRGCMLMTVSLAWPHPSGDFFIPDPFHIARRLARPQ